LSALAAGDHVRVSGFRAADGELLATRLELASPDAKLRVLGRVARLDRARARFFVEALAVDYSSALSIDGFPAGQPSDGDQIVAVGTRAGDGALRAEQLRLQAASLPRPGESAEIEGLITRFTAADDFDVAGVPVAAGAATDYEGGSAASLALNVKVKAEGTVDPSGKLLARKIEVKDGGRVVTDGG
jgi:hypothetical protein